MKHLKTPINEFANSLRLAGMFMLTAGAIGLVADSANTDEGFDFFKGAMLHLVVAGSIMGFTGESLWKILYRNSNVTKRQLFIRDEM